MQDEIIEGYRISPQQRQLWLAQQESARPYLAECAVRVEGSLDAVILKEALRRVVERHEILRTTFRRLAGMSTPLQVIGDASLGWETRTAAEGLCREGEDEVGRRLLEARRGHFDLERGPQLHAALAARSGSEHVLTLTLPALCADAAGLANLVGELARSYGACLLDAEVEGEPTQYADVSEALNDLLESEETEAGRRYWQHRDSGATGAPALPFERDGATAGEYDARTLRAELSPELFARVETAAERLGVNVPAFLLGCWHTLLHRLNGAPEVSVAAAYPGRTIEGVEDAVGLFVRHIPVSLDFKAQEPLGQTLRRLADALEEQAEWQDYFSPELLARHGDESNDTRALPIGFEYVAEAPPVAAGGLRFTLLRVRAEAARFALKLTCRPVGGGAELEFAFDASRYDAAQAERLRASYLKVLEGAAAWPEREASELEIVGEAERTLLLEEWNDTRADYGQWLLHQPFERQAAATPDAVALAFEDESLTYRELNERANRLAHHLRALGVGTESVVAVMMERCVELVVGLLATLKAGAAYLPLDPSYPAQRLSFMLEDARPKVLLTQQRLRDSVSVPEGGVVLALDEEGELSRQPSDNPRVELDANNLAYVIYTSGSTGRPKGVMVSHRAIANRVLWMTHRFAFDSSERVLQKTSSSFDASVWELFAPLCVGGRLVLARPGGERDSAYLVEAVDKHGITTLQLVPSMLQVVLGEERFSGCSSLRRVFCGGEALGADLRDRFHGLQAAELHNLYGPTEAAIDATHWPCARGEQGVVPIGRPIGNVRVYVLDKGMRPAPVGVAGELYIGGVGLARGYMGRASLTAERFVPDPFSGEPGARLYRTGDAARHRADGAVEYLGRGDEQVKVRGYRIELGEIESALRAHEGVKEAAVIAREEAGGHRRLVAYVVPAGGESRVVVDEQLYTLPNGLRVAHVNRNEAEVIYKEIFEDETYLQHGVTLNDGDCVFDVGANIGLFSLFVQRRCPAAAVYAFEPVPPVFDKLRANATLHGANTRLFDYGLSDRSKETKITFYPNWSGMSGVYADMAEDEAVTRAYLENRDASLMQYADELLEERFKTETYDCRLRSLSEVIREQGVERIDLLKVDVEKSELDVLRGIEEADWKKIKQVVMEAHDLGGQLAEIVSLLRQHGFDLTYEQDASQQNTALYNLYAVHPSRDEAAPSRRPSDARLMRGPTEALTAAALGEFLQERLPDYMIPAAFVLLDALPRTSNGKLDRLALPAPDAARPDEGPQTPRTPVEELLAHVWSQVLGLSRVGVHDNFFELGGDSLMVTQLVSRLRQVFNVQLSLRTIFERPTVALLSEVVEASSRGGEGAPPLERAPRGGEMPLSFAQQRLWYVEQLQPGGHAYNIGAAVRVEGELDVAAIEQSFSRIVERHEALRTTFGDDDGRPFQVVSPETSVAVRVEDLRAIPEGSREAEAARLAAEEARRPFDLARGPLLRVSLLRTAEREHVLLLTMHHIISDGWSLGLLIGEMGAFYAAALAGAEAAPPELPLQYADFASWQRRWLQGEVLEAQLDYWRRQLEGMRPLQLPTDLPRPAARTLRGAHVRLTLPAPLTESLKELGRREGATLFMTLLAAFAALLRRRARQDEIVVGADVANRNRAEVEGLIGFFVNQLVMRLDLSGNPTFRELLERARAVTLGAYVHQDTPFDQVVKALKPERDPSRAPLFQVKLVLQNAPLPELRLPGLTLKPFDVEMETAHLDLTLFLWEADGGLAGSLQYNTDLFRRETVGRLVEQFTRLLAAVAQDPEARLDALDGALDGAEGEERIVEQSKRREAERTMFRNIKPRAVGLSGDDLVKTSELGPGVTLPLVVRPATDEVDLVDWARNGLDFIRQKLHTHGALLFRGFGHEGAADFEQLASAVCGGDLFNENGEHPRQSVSGQVYTPVFYPPEQQLLWHNENSFNLRWPMKILFCCVKPAETGGETPIADSRAVFERIDPRIRERFVEKKVMYVRNYGNGLGLNWETVFRTDDRREVEEQCRRTGMTFEWKTGNRLRTRCVRPAVGRHPQTGEMVWFNQAQHWHVSCLDPATRESVLALFPEDDWPRSCYYGDGSTIEDSVMAEILGVYKELEVSFPWRRGDIMLLDNMLAAHGRNAYTGERKLLVSMGEMSHYGED